jgi:hypothetical protein
MFYLKKCCITTYLFNNEDCPRETDLLKIYIHFIPIVMYTYQLFYKLYSKVYFDLKKNVWTFYAINYKLLDQILCGTRLTGIHGVS